ncbi:tyrosine-type recombinase/integrase [Vibrio natriegens]|uniref:Tyr recombinase domain-containing protein n=1 Tax=Vibrio natriegens NBRC 15636 = ATCC 14048 = DSM 759 TaxID=1219067 RepID=A0AAN1CXT4_VIBNA|nr:tyrosine-type recombinase/integrase [Vibrio natriegens]ALR18515.1 hypothetical protein PN96_21615 [Vibrio natriegens NBRC 15636 = ATCC 14048 = DSM 759]ANQ14468.1 hypothetical protein BA890_17110 [Vibrio natriegens NBRC 15636 = ATCC 14048 = DSM 759]EPM38826.1 hypothetical protein M272_20660 [Vibrio natriegens NBRC 15636 = ATCC 14048 = DSM 759]MDX6028580.1 tyrosine-type recombinase/integrase [Vibrio natriegens NBRC 15636 = ATCC 14048 = DSM 759]UUI14694.1 tyrosine-type recombinase/integrase [V
MYLFKNRYSVYFVRLCTPKTLVKLGYPFDFKFSLKTKIRAIAIRRSQPIIIKVLESLDKVDPDRDCHKKVRSEIVSTVNALRASFTDEGTHYSPSIFQSGTSEPKAIRNNFAQGYKWQQDFIASKQQQRITNLTVHQLNQRTRYFLDHLKKKKLSIMKASSSDLMAFADHLHMWRKSSKTKKDYWSAAKQFVKWLHLKQHLKTNPFEGMSMTFKSEKYASDQRERWSNEEVKTLLASNLFKASSCSLQWTTLLLIYMGLRPTEACQLTVNDIKTEKGMFVLNITDKGEAQKLKNQHSLRTIPIPTVLIKKGFIDYVRHRRQVNKLYLFDWKPRGNDCDWTKQYRTQFGKIQTSINMKPNDRPTAYGFRHTFIDCLKQTGVEEYQVAEVVGHANPNMTYGRYGKKLTLVALIAVVEMFSIDDDQQAL